jgi:SOS-response transcriptional repressor LexA
MHPLQNQLLELARSRNLAQMSLREIGKLFGEEKYPQKIKHHLLQLQKKGLLRIDIVNKTAEVVEPEVKNYFNLFSIPVFGYAHCGAASIFANEKITGYLKVSSDLLPGNKTDLIAVKAMGSRL